MTTQKKLKKAIRARSHKTGESYTAARRQVLESRRRKGGGAAPTPAPPKTPTTRAASAPRRGQSEVSLVAKTGHGLAHWFAVLDRFDAAKKGHTASAAHLCDAHGVPGWRGS